MQPAAGEVSGRNRKMQGACREYTEYLESMSLKERNRKPGALCRRCLLLFTLQNQGIKVVAGIPSGTLTFIGKEP